MKMTMPTTNLDAIIEAVKSGVSPEDKPIRLHDWLAEYLVDTEDHDKKTAFEIAEHLIPKVQARIRTEQDEALGSGNTWVVEVFGSEGEYVRSASLEDKSLPFQEQQIRASRRHIDDITSSLRGLSPAEFERACTAIIRLFGAKEPKTSSLSNDGGIDFYGRLELKGRLDSHLPYGGIDDRVGLWLMGQAKRYNPANSVQTADIRELVGSVELARTGGAIHDWEGLHLRPFDAVIQLFFTTGRFSAGSIRLLEKSGIIHMDGTQLATFLADCRIGIDEITNTFSEKLFKNNLDL